MVVQRHGSEQANVTSSDGWDLFALYQHEYVDVRPQAGGIEITTRNEPAGLVRFVNRSGSTEIRCGDYVALAVQGAWLQFDPTKRPLEISAEIYAEPLPPESYQWRIGGCATNERLVTAKSFALVNVNAKDALVGCRRVYGPPFCWDEQQLMGLEKQETE